ncbi:MAG: tRNA 2-selenouridine(34) synthase MnmH [Betaproteobacteria bacterium]|nr:MAG: tRNA 2-selenouridine(34) synthase MnmH [Betaproteobacteria bacterium]
MPLPNLTGYAALIDARSPSEYAEDHIPGAINLPVLNDAERAEVGTIYTQVSAFQAKKIGAALVSRNIASHLEHYFNDKARAFTPLVYCWRGGNRSGAMTTILRAVGWGAVQLEGGYKAFRRQVLDDLVHLPARFDLRIIGGPTGVGKSLLLRALAEEGAQVLDLEDLAAHKGSVLGPYPDRPQPSQKFFETLIWSALSGFDPSRPVFVEAESKRVGRVHVPDALIAAMRAAPIIRLEATLAVRVALLKADYAYYLADPDDLCRQLDCLTALRGHETVEHWKTLARDGAWDVLVNNLLEAHYDPLYARSLGQNYTAETTTVLQLDSPTAEAFSALARQIAQR